MSTLNSKFDILRGWPNSSAVAEDWVVPTIGVGEDALKTGAWVRLDPAQKTAMTCLSELKADKDSPVFVAANGLQKCPALYALVIEGTDEYSSAFGSRVTVLLGGGYVVRLYNNGVAGDAMFTAGGMAPGRPVALVNGLITDCGRDVGATFVAGDIVPMGRCLRVDTDAGTCDIYVD